MDAGNVNGKQLEGYCRILAASELKEDAETREESLKELRTLIENETNILIPEEDEFLLRFLRVKKFNVKKSFDMIQKYYLMKLNCPDLFRCPLPVETQSVFELQTHFLLSSRDKSGRRIYIFKIANLDASRVTIDEVFRANILTLEHVVREYATQITGLVVILDMAGLSLNHTRFFTPYYAKKIMELVQDTFPLRFKEFHIVNEPFYFDAIMVMLKPFLKEKMKKRIFLHGNDVNSLASFFDAEILPVEYGGCIEELDNSAWYHELLSAEEYFRDLQKYGYKVENNAEGD